jgi:hypothetical protein
MICSNNYAFGKKQLEEDYAGLLGQIVSVDSVVLPQWAKDRHHFIFANAMALEHQLVTNKLHLWIDLIFGDKQHNHESYNLFKPLTSDVHDPRSGLARHQRKGGSRQ